ncbi:MAG: type I DNA topoisomerase [Planctomycetes bacterium]|nr:type I DNA topoisomerase [Planctomycetota bacterium]
MAKSLVIVESPTKAKTLERFLGKDYVVESSVGHVRDLPASAAEIPPALKKEAWARLGVNVEQDFEPLYVVAPEKKKKIAELKSLAKQVDRILLATDEDREGEAISWHLLELLQPKVPVRRMVFHEITKAAILRSLEETRDLDEDLVQAQETRRIIDRLYGYEVSPILWRKIAPKLSAGRVQSVAIRMLVERELARMRFKKALFWDLVATFLTAGEKSFEARLIALGGKRVASGKDFDPDTGKLRRDDVVLVDEAKAGALLTSLRQGRFRVSDTEEKPFTKSPAPPFTTSTLQQEGNRKLRFDARRTMRAAQRLYENGFITYMRTDSVALSDEAIRITRAAVSELFGAEFLPGEARHYRNKVKNAQEAHEAIRPAGERVASVDDIRAKLGADEARVYELIFKRTLACQMKDAKGRRMTLQVEGEAGSAVALFQASGQVIDFHGFLRAYVEELDESEGGGDEEREAILPPVKVGEPLRATQLDSERHETAPPPRLTEASLVKALEESGIGRPSTYASIIDTIERREYTFKKGTALVPTFTAFAVVQLLRDHFSDLVDYEFTARMEDRLDAISRGELEMKPYLREFYFGNGTPGLRPLLDLKSEAIDPRTVCTVPIGVDAEGRTVVVRVGRYGPYLQRGEDETAPVPEQTCPDEVTLAQATEWLEGRAKADEPIATHPETGQPIYLKNGRFGPYVQMGDAKAMGKGEKPKMVSLLKGMTPESITPETALALLSLPRVLGQDAEGRDIVAHNGRFGPFIKRGDDTRSLSASDHLLTIDLARALELLAQEKRGRSFTRGTPQALKSYGAVEALGGAEVKLMPGRYGPYVTDGEVNASLPKDTADPTEVPLEQVLTLLAAARERAASGGGKRKAARKPARSAGGASAKKAAKKASKRAPRAEE